MAELAVWAPGKDSVDLVAGDRRTPMTAAGGGWSEPWSGTAALASGKSSNGPSSSTACRRGSNGSSAMRAIAVTSVRVRRASASGTTKARGKAAALR